jgi:hypothetical protein
MVLARVEYSVDHLPITNARRLRNSHIDITSCGPGILLIILEVGMLSSPFKIFPCEFLFFLTGCPYYAYTHATEGRFGIPIIHERRPEPRNV